MVHLLSYHSDIGLLAVMRLCLLLLSCPVVQGNHEFAHLSKITVSAYCILSSALNQRTCLAACLSRAASLALIMLLYFGGSRWTTGFVKSAEACS